MVKIYNTDKETNEFKQIKEFTRGSWINLVAPTEKEIKTVCDNLKIPEEFIRYSLDNEERARIDMDEEDDLILFIIDVPITERDGNATVYTTMPIGLITVRDDFFLTVSLKEVALITTFEQNKIKNFATYKKSRFILQMMYQNASDYLTYLKKINRATEKTEKVLGKTMKNKELLTLLNLEKSLVYITTSLRSNEAVMEKTLKVSNIKLYDEDEDILEDAIIENKQAIEMSRIYSDILNSTMDAYSSIISNNVNSVMKFLTAITIVIAIPTMISSFWGMNVVLPFQNSIYGFVIMIALATILTLLVTWLLKKKDMF